MRPRTLRSSNGYYYNGRYYHTTEDANAAHRREYEGRTWRSVPANSSGPRWSGTEDSFLNQITTYLDNSIDTTGPDDAPENQVAPEVEEQEVRYPAEVFSRTLTPQERRYKGATPQQVAAALIWYLTDEIYLQFNFEPDALGDHLDSADTMLQEFCRGETLNYVLMGQPVYVEAFLWWLLEEYVGHGQSQAAQLQADKGSNEAEPAKADQEQANAELGLGLSRRRICREGGTP